MFSCHLDGVSKNVFHTRGSQHIVRVSAVADENNGRAFVGTAELHVGVLDFFPAALWAGFVDGALGVDVVSLKGLNAGLQFLPESRGEIRGLRLGNDSFGTDICAQSSLSASHSPSKPTKANRSGGDRDERTSMLSAAALAA